MILPPQVAVSTKISQEQRSKLERKAQETGFRSICAYLRYLVTQELTDGRQSVNPQKQGRKNDG